MKTIGIFLSTARAACDNTLASKGIPKPVWIRGVGFCKKYSTKLNDEDLLTFQSRFVHARHSRERLNTTREMLMLSFTYFQVMPDFIDLLLSFGYQTDAQDFYVSLFRQRTHLSSPYQGIKVPELGWSGRGIQLCYNLKSVEHSSSQKDWPWSVRQCAIHHSFDSENVRTSWIVIKADDLIKKRMQSATSNYGPSVMSSFNTLDRAFAATLATHLILCDWSAENWRWYINFLENRYQDISRSALSTKLDIPSRPQMDKDAFSMASSQSQTMAVDKSSPMAQKQPFPCRRTHTDPHTGLSQPLPPGMLRLEIPDQAQTQDEHHGQRGFSIRDLQDIHSNKKRVNEAVLVLRLNISVISQLKQYYRSIINLKEVPEMIGLNCKEDIIQFERRIDEVEHDLQRQVLRTETLLRLLADNKNLVRATPSTYLN